MLCRMQSRTTKDNTNEMGTRVRAGRSKIVTVFAFSICLVFLLTYIRTRSIGGVAAQGAIVTEHASGTFEVKLAPSGEADKAEGSTLG
jgi:hypothetical protein